MKADSQIKSVKSASVLRWYDRCARQLPWRVGPAARKQGVCPDPYAVWLSEIMLQQTTVATVTPRYLEFLEKWPTVSHMAAASLDDVLGQWAGLGYYARARNLHKCACVVVEQYQGKFPQTEQELLTLPGIGPYSAAAIAAIAFDKRAIVVDGNIERVVSRLFAIEDPLPKSKPIIKEIATEFWPKNRSGDFAQALMDLGAGVCKPRNPDCKNCPLAKSCSAYDRGDPETFPRKARKKAKPTRFGHAYILVNADGDILFERRPEKGLLGGMIGLPGTDWTETKTKKKLASAPGTAAWTRLGQARHTFTHFNLMLDVHQGKTKREPKPHEIWKKPHEVRLPTAMQKALDLALDKNEDQP